MTIPILSDLFQISNHLILQYAASYYKLNQLRPCSSVKRIIVETAAKANTCFMEIHGKRAEQRKELHFIYTIHLRQIPATSTATDWLQTKEAKNQKRMPDVRNENTLVVHQLVF